MPDKDTGATRAGSVQRMTETQYRMPNDKVAADAVQGSIRAGHAATTGVLQGWADSLAGLPFTVLSRGDVGPVMSGRIWLDGTFELVDVWWTVHRRSVEQLLGAQRRAAEQMVDSGWALAEMNRALVQRSRAHTAPGMRP